MSQPKTPTNSMNEPIDVIKCTLPKKENWELAEDLLARFPTVDRGELLKDMIGLCFYWMKWGNNREERQACDFLNEVQVHAIRLAKEKHVAGNPVTDIPVRDHHLLCLGVLAGIYQKDKAYDGFTDINYSDELAIEEAIASAEKLGLPVSLERLKRGEPVCTLVRQ